MYLKFNVKRLKKILFPVERPVERHLYLKIDRK